MLKIKTILTPLDFSDRAILAAEHAAALARRFDSALIFAHIIPPAPYEYAAFDEGFYAAATWPELDAVQESIGKRLDELIEKIQPGRPVEQIIKRGDPAREIENIVKERSVGLVVMPTHGYGPFRRLVLGSVTAKVLHDISTPVFTGVHVPEVTPIDPDPYKRIACAVDLDEHGQEVLDWAWGLAQACTEDLVVIHAAPQIEVGGTYGDWFPPETREQIVAGARKRLDEMLVKTGCKAEVHVESADPVRYVTEVADKGYADILVIGRSMKDGALAGLRAQARALIRQAPCPVISV